MNVEARVGHGIQFTGEAQSLRESTGILDPANLLQLLRIRWLLILGIALAPFAIAVAIIFSLAPRYSAEAIVTLDQRTNSVTDVDAVLSKLSGDATTVQAQLQILRSRSFLSQVIDRAKLQDDPAINQTLRNDGGAVEGNFIARILTALQSASEFRTDGATKTPDEEAQDTKNAIIDRLQSGLTLSPLGPAIRIEFRSENPQQAARVANAIADNYIEDQLNTKFQATETATKFLSDRITELSSQVRVAETDLARFRSQNDLVDPGQGPSSVDQQLAALNSQLIVARLDLAQQTTKAGRIRELQQAGRGPGVTEIVDSPIITQLRAEEADIRSQEADLSSKYGPRHPKIIEIQSQKINLQRKIADEASRIAQAATNDLDLAQAKVRSLEQSLNAIEQRVAERDQSIERRAADRNQSLATLKQLEERLASTRSLHEASLARFNQIQDREEIQRPDARILSYAAVPRAPNFPPSKVLMFGLAAPASIFLGFLAMVLREILVSGFRTGAQLEGALALPVLAVTPEVTDKKVKAAGFNIVNDRPLSSFAESMRGIMLGLHLPDIDHPPKVILVTSAVPQEGKSTVALSLARSAARNGQKVVLVDCDFRRPSLRTMVRARGLKKGLVEALRGRDTVENCFHKDDHSEVLLLVPETMVEDPANLIGSAEMENLIRDLRGLADCIIIDSAPLLPVNDTKLLIPLVDTMLLLVRWEKTPRNAAIAAARILFDLRAPVAGVVVTRADPRQYYGYNYGLKNYSSYAKYYRD